ncbi:unnamed protein product [Peronospora destructor]|uniref:Uncharacterized protein n=1 Tax=Peronospora destructor TaxID=86335 RepID=A0AAV0U1W3_9STRA|nr:unnamed protein product [Peronospora destructor]
MSGAGRSVSRFLRPRRPSRTSRRCSFLLPPHVLSAALHSAIFTCPASALVDYGRNTTDDSETALAQQMLDFMKLAEDDERVHDVPLSMVQAELSVSGVIMGVQNGLARVSGLRHATIGSIVSVSDASGQFLCRGLVLFLKKKLVHVAPIYHQ